MLTDTPHDIIKATEQTQLSERGGYIVIPSGHAINWVLLFTHWDVAESGNHCLGAPFLLNWILYSEQLLDILGGRKCQGGSADGSGARRRTLDTDLSLPWFGSAGGGRIREGAKIVGSEFGGIEYWLGQVWIVDIVEY